MGCGGSSSSAEGKYKQQEKAAVALASAPSAKRAKEEDNTGNGGNADAADKVTKDDAHREKLEVAKQVYIFRHLGPHQLDLLVNSFNFKQWKKGDQVIVQHEYGDSFFVVTTGEVQVLIDGKKVRNLGKNAYFGERALLFDEPRSATVEVVSQDVETWSVDKPTFMQIVKGKMQQQLMHRIRMQDTTVTLDDLKMVRRIGEGAAGSVDLVEHQRTHTRYALK